MRACFLSLSTESLAVTQYAVNIAVFEVRQWTYRRALLCSRCTVDLRGHWESLNSYEALSTNQLDLASLVELGWLAPQALDAFRTLLWQTLLFIRLVGIEPTADCSIYSCSNQMSYNATHDLVLPQLLTGLLNLSIQHEKYLSPAGYSMMFCDRWDVDYSPVRDLRHYPRNR